MKALTRPKITATTKMMPTRCRRVVAADEAEPMDEVGDHPQSESGDPGRRMTNCSPWRVNLLPDADE